MAKYVLHGCGVRRISHGGKTKPRKRRKAFEQEATGRRPFVPFNCGT